MTFYEEKARLMPRMGYSTERPFRPPDKHALWWELDTGLMWAANDGMDWVCINPADTGQFHIATATIAVSAYPSGQLWEIPPLGAYVYEVRVRVEQVYDAGITCTIGDMLDVDRLAEAEDVDLEVVGDYVTHPLHTYAGGSFINVYLSAVSAFGIATVNILYDENPS